MIANVPPNPRHLLLRPRGRLSRAGFAVALAALLIVTFLATALMRALDPATAAGFWTGLALIILFPFMLYSVYGQRLHDLGRTVWPLTAALAASFLILIGVMLAFGGAEYFSEFSQYDRKEVIDTERVEELRGTYERELADGGEQRASLLLGLLWGVLTAWLLIAPGERDENKYGLPPQSASG